MHAGGLKHQDLAIVNSKPIRRSYAFEIDEIMVVCGLGRYENAKKTIYFYFGNMMERVVRGGFRNVQPL